MEKKILELPIFPLKDSVMFPKIMVDFQVSDNKLKKWIDEIDKLEEDERLMIFVTESFYDVENSKRLFYTVGTVGKIFVVHKNADVYSIEAQGLFRAKLLERVKNQAVKVEILVDKVEIFTIEESIKIQNYIKKIKNVLKEIQILMSKIYGPIESWFPIKNVDEIKSLPELEEVVYTFIFHIPLLRTAEKQEILLLNNLILRLAKIWNFLIDIYNNLKFQKQILDTSGLNDKGDIFEAGKNFQDSNQLSKEYSRLNRQYNNIKSLLSEEMDRVIKEDLERLRISRLDSTESVQIITHLEFLLNFPWGKYTKDPSDFNYVKQILNSDHYGLEHIKERIIEFLAVKKLNPQSRGSILCFVGPPGVGKTSLGQSIARALNRKFIRISLGGVHDEAEIRGHRRTYIGALPGKILQEIKRCGTLNPVFMIDEIDKIGREYHKGDPSSALLEALDPEQNFAFRDNYVGAGVDLSRILFITTANVLDTIQKPLLDRMEIIHLSSYTEFEKIQIAKNFLIPKQLKENGLADKMNINFSDEILSLIINSYTDEAGVRELERKIASLFRKIAKDYLLNKFYREINIKEKFVKETFGSKIFKINKSRETSVGVAIGLAFTPSGGRILFIESAKFSSNQYKKLSQTGTLGDIFKESIKICLTLIRSKYFMDKSIDKYVFHVHVPEGATPKDGPSAGIAIFTALYSLVLNKKVKANLAMTGEINLEGLILPVGGIKEKVIAAERAGIKEVILPFENQSEIENIPQEIREKLKFHFVKTIDEAIKIAFDN